LRSVVNLSRKDWFGTKGHNPCGPTIMPITDVRPEWTEMNAMLQELWRTYGPGKHGNATHPNHLEPNGKDKLIWDPKDVCTKETKAVKQWLKANTTSTKKLIVNGR
jgi:hypothetical protein